MRDLVSLRRASKIRQKTQRGYFLGAHELAGSKLRAGESIALTVSDYCELGKVQIVRSSPAKKNRTDVCRNSGFD